jgi:hypothetical protein
MPHSIPPCTPADIYQSIYTDHTAHHRLEAVADGDQQVHKGGLTDCQGNSRCTYCCCCWYCCDSYCHCYCDSCSLSSVISMPFSALHVPLHPICTIQRVSSLQVSVSPPVRSPSHSLSSVVSSLVLDPRSITEAIAAQRSKT